MEKGNPHAVGAGASGVLGRNPQASSIPLPTGAILLSRAEAFELTELLVTIEHLTSRFGPMMIEKLDIRDGDPDLEPGGDDEPVEANGDTQDAAWPEWHGLRPAWRKGPMLNPGHEDAEEDDDDACLAADDLGTEGSRYFESDGLPGDPADAEDGYDREQEGDGI